VRRLVLEMVDPQEQLLAVNSRIMTSKLGGTFNDDVYFAWENDRKEGPAVMPKKDWGCKVLNKHVIVEDTEKADYEHQAMLTEDIGNEAARMEESPPDAAGVV
jgi:hypothetical protein